METMSSTTLNLRGHPLHAADGALERQISGSALRAGVISATQQGHDRISLLGWSATAITGAAVWAAIISLVI